MIERIKALVVMWDILQPLSYVTREYQEKDKYIYLDRSINGIAAGIAIVDKTTGTIYGVVKYGHPNKRRVIGNIGDDLGVLAQKLLDLE